MPPAPIDLSLIAAGSRFTASGLLAARDEILLLVDANAARFAAYKVDSAWRKQIAATSTKIESALAARDAAESDLVPSTVAYEAAFANAKQWRDDCMTHADNAFEAGAEHQKFHVAAAKVGESASRLIASIGKLSALATTYAKELKTEGASAKFAAEGTVAAAALKSAKATHDGSLRALTPKQQAAQAAKGSLYELLKRASRVARRQHLTNGKSINVATMAVGHAPKPRAPKGPKAPPAAKGSTPAATTATAK
ncbi:MAG: hypothetical protein ACHREM_30735 [Polyangiales bacterium]